MRRILDIKEGESLKLCIENRSIVIEKFEQNCSFCGKSNPDRQYLGKTVCSDCLIELKKI